MDIGKLGLYFEEYLLKVEKKDQKDFLHPKESRIAYRSLSKDSPPGGDCGAGRLISLLTSFKLPDDLWSGDDICSPKIERRKSVNARITYASACNIPRLDIARPLSQCRRSIGA